MEALGLCVAPLVPLQCSGGHEQARRHCKLVTRRQRLGVLLESGQGVCFYGAAAGLASIANSNVARASHQLAL
jgi:hypothetical protein